MSRIVGVLLAAGSGQRFGAHKLHQPLADHTPLGVAAARSLVDALPESVAVVRPGDHVLHEAFAAMGLIVVENPVAARGMGASLAVGVRAAAGADGWLIALADMPWIRPATIRGLADRLATGASIVVPEHAGRRGHPVGFTHRWGAELGMLSGDRGARDLIAANAGLVQRYATEDAGVLRDVDRRSDLLRAVAAGGRDGG